MVRGALFGLAAAMCLSAASTPTADEVMAAAQQRAAAEHKTVFLIFHASW